MNESKPSQYIYINKPLPRRYNPPTVVSERTVSVEQARDLLKSNDVAVAMRADASDIADAILEAFLQEEVLLGPGEHVTKDREHWRRMLQRFIDRGKPIAFVAMAFPYKVPNPIKTGERLAPDAGEALMLRRFHAVLAAISDVYRPGSRLTILEEGILGRGQGVPPQEVAAYRAGIGRVMTIAGTDDGTIDFHSLDDMVERVPNFEARWYFEQERLRGLWDAGDPAMREAYDAVYPGQRSTVPLRDYDRSLLVRAFDQDEHGSELRYVRQYFEAIAHRQFFSYRALLNLRDSSGFLEEIRPGALKLTVSPKKGNLGVVPINEATHVLPYHGAPIRRADGSWTIDYFADLGEYGDLTAIHVEGDADPAPFAYVENA